MLRVLLLFLFCVTFANAQRTAFYNDEDALYKQGLDLFDKKQFVNAQKNFNTIYEKTRSSVLKSDAAYYAAACGIELFNKDSEWLMREFIKNYPASTKINKAYYYLAISNFRKKKYKETLEYFEKVDVYQLDKNKLAEFYFKRGYSYLQTNSELNAKPDFYEIKDVDNKYAFPANYYYSHIVYNEKNYETALQGFNRLVNNETFGKVVPYYITQIYFMQGKFEKVVEEAPKLLNDSVNIQKEAEINRMIGESYFNLRDYKNALPYLKKSSLNAQGNYVLGICYYKLSDYTNAMPYFEKATVEKDSLAQSAWYHHADCHVKLNQKAKAKNAFYSAYQLNFDEKITEDALFSFAKLSYELDFNPYNEAVKGFTKYLREYPNSQHKDECYNFLITVYSTTKNYEQAILSIESLESIDPILKVTYQRLIYFRGVEFFNNSDLDNAEKQFKKSLAQNSDISLNALNQYWLAEISYLRRDYSTAIEAWKKFQIAPGAIALKEYDLSNYAIGYAYFHRKEKEDYTNANISFRKFLLTKNTYDQTKIIDATIRAADCYFMNRDFAQASDYYSRAINFDKLDVDYALFQKALCDGLNKNYEAKIIALKKLETQYPGSNYLSAALNEIADTYYSNLKEEENAITYYQRILKMYPNSSFVNNCHAQLGNIYYGRHEDEKAFVNYDLFVKSDATSAAAKEILESIKKIFEAKGDIEGMKAYFEDIGNPLSETELEKATYAAAYDAFYTQKNCELAIQKWEAYISKFPTGKYVAEAYFNAAECYYSSSQFGKALERYSYIISRQRSTYSETALVKSSYLLFKDKKYLEALPLFQQLEDLAETPANKIAGQLGAMRCSFYTQNYSLALEQSTKVLAAEKLTPQQINEASYIKARSLFESKRFDDALAEFKALSKSSKNVSGAEAHYYISKIYFAKQDYKEVEKSINKLISYPYSNDDWNNKGMLLLADAYITRGDTADSKIILESILDSNPNVEIAKEAQERLDKILEKEEQAKALREQLKEEETSNTELKVDFQQNENDKNLFNQEDAVIPATTDSIPQPN